MARRINTEFRVGKQKFVIFRKKDWDRFCDMIAEEDNVVAASGGDCGTWCASECEHEGGCRRSWTTSGGCGGLCVSGAVVI